VSTGVGRAIERAVEATGGSNAIANLWPQPRAAAHRKDLDANRLHDEICAGEISLAAARAEMLRLWAQ